MAVGKTGRAGGCERGAEAEFEERIKIANEFYETISRFRTKVCGIIFRFIAFETASNYSLGKKKKEKIIIFVFTTSFERFVKFFFFFLP